MSTMTFRPDEEAAALAADPEDIAEARRILRSPDPPSDSHLLRNRRDHGGGDHSRRVKCLDAEFMIAVWVP